MGDFDVTVAAGSRRSDDPAALRMAHRWTDAGVTVETTFTGGHLLHLSIAGCVLNDLYREADALGIVLDGVRVSATGGFDTSNWTSTGITYSVELDSAADPAALAELLRKVDEVAEIPKAVRAGTSVSRAL